MNKIEKLTPDQAAQIPIWHADLLAAGRAIGDVDRPKCRTAITEMYRLIGKPAPIFVFLDSPMECCAAIGGVRAVASTPSLESSLGSSLESSLWSSLWSHAQTAINECFWGQHESSWIAFYAFCRDVAGVRYSEKDSAILDLWADLARSCFWWWPYEGVVFVSSRPSVLSIDAGGRLHSATGAAMGFADGYGVFAWHGTRVPEQIIKAPETLTADQVRNEANSEISRAMAERLGDVRYLDLMGTEAIDRWVDPKTGLSYELLDLKKRFGDTQPRWIRKQSSVLKDRTQPFYVERVDPRLTSAQAARKAQAMLAFCDKNESEIAKVIAHCNKNPSLEYAWEA